ncbi:MAG: flippase-like domain-containing protein [Actinobacteria bacterium]|nr:flippase-like domain-containing protein [Actinomycetota bacterium]
MKSAPVVAGTARGDSEWSVESVAIDEVPEPESFRSTADLLRILVSLALVALVILAGSVGSETTIGIQEDITTAVTNVPKLVVSLLATLNTLIVFCLPVYLIAELALRKRWRVLWTSLAAAALALVAAEVFASYAPELLAGGLLDSLTQPLIGGSGQTPAAFGLFAAVSALMTVEGSGTRPRTLVVVWSCLLALALLFIIDGRATPLALLVSVLVGHVIGLLVRYAAGTENPRVGARKIAEALGRVELKAVTMVQLPVESKLGRQFTLLTADGTRARVQVLDPDRGALRVLRQLTRVLRVRTWVTRTPSLSARVQVQQAAVPALMAREAQVRTPRFLAAAEVDDRTLVFAEERPEELRVLSTFSADAISDEALSQTWKQVRKMHHAGVAHEGLNPESLAVDNDGRIWILGLTQGEIAASRLRMRLDRAELLLATALLVGVDRAITAADAVIGDQDLANLPALLQPVALNPALRLALKDHAELLDQVREEATARAPEPSADEVRLERLKPRALVTLIAATLAVYVLAGQLSNVDFATVIRSINWYWAGLAFLASLMTYVGAALTIRPFLPVRVPALRLLAAQFAATFVSLVAPAAVGSAGTNVRVIQKAGAPSGLAVASVGLSSLVVFATTLLALFGVTIFSHEATQLDLKAPSTGVLLVAVGAVLIAAFAFLLPATRRLILKRMRPIWESTGPRVLDVARDPKRLVQGVAASLLTSLAYAVTLFVSVRAYGDEIPLAGAVVVYLGAGLVGSVAPTPGGIGAVEAALVAGLSAIGVPAAVALPSALLYRTVTFWLPTLPGWFSFRWLQSHEAI